MGAWVTLCCRIACAERCRLFFYGDTKSCCHKFHQSECAVIEQQQCRSRSWRSSIVEQQQSQSQLAHQEQLEQLQCCSAFWFPPHPPLPSTRPLHHPPLSWRSSSSSLNSCSRSCKWLSSSLASAWKPWHQ